MAIGRKFALGSPAIDQQDQEQFRLTENSTLTSPLDLSEGRRSNILTRGPGERKKRKQEENQQIQFPRL